MNTRFNILWIDDQHETAGIGFIDEAEESGFTIFPFTNSDEGMAFLKENPNDVDGIILDARVFKSSDDTRPGRKGLTPSLTAIPQICERYRGGKVPPTVVYTGADEFQDDDDFAEEMKGTSLEIEVFKKNQPNELLFETLRKKIGNAPEASIRNRYRDIYEACHTGEIDVKCWQLLLPSLLAIESHSPPPENHYNDIRIAVEYALRLLHAKQVLPPQIIEDDKVALQLSSIFLSGRPARFNRSGESITTHDGNPLLPKLIADGLRFVLNTTQPASHSDTATNPRAPSIVAVESEVPTHHILQTITYMTVDFIQWCINFVSRNPDHAENCNLWTNVLPETGADQEETCDGVVNNFDQFDNAFVKPDEGGDNIRIKANMMTISEVKLAAGQRVQVTYKPTVPDRGYRECVSFEVLETQ